MGFGSRRWTALIALIGATCSAPPPTDLAPELRGVNALLDDGRYDEGERQARVLYERAGRMAGADSDVRWDAASVLIQAAVANGHGAADEVQRLAADVLAARRSQNPTNREPLVDALVNLGDVLGDVEANDRAVDVLKEAVSLEEAAPQQPERLAGVLDHLSAALSRAEQFDEAARVGERSLALKDAATAPPREVARTLEVLARAMQGKGDYEGASPHLDRALALRAATDRAHPEYVATLSRLSMQEWSRGRLDAARDAAAEAVALAQKTLRKTHPKLTRAMGLLASAQLDLWEVDRARELLQQALALAETEFGAENAAVAWYVNELASATFMAGAYAEARVLYERAAGLLSTHPGSNRDVVATVAVNLALVNIRLGDLDSARAQYERAMATWREKYPEDHPYLVSGLSGLARILRDQGKPQDALPLFERVLTVKERVYGPRNREVARTQIQIAKTLKLLGRDADALRYTTRALDIWQAAANRDDPDYADALSLLGDLNTGRGQFDVAGKVYAQVLALDERVMGPAHPNVARDHLSVATIQAKSGDGKRAFAEGAAAETIGREHLRLMLRGLSEREALNYAATRPRGVDVLLSVLAADPEAVSPALDAVIRARALVSDEVAMRRQMAQQGVLTEQQGLVTKLADAQQRLANMTVGGRGSMTRARYDQLLDETRRQAEMAERELAEASSAFRTSRRLSQAGLNEVMSGLPPDIALVSFVRYLRTPRGPGAAAPHYVAFIVRAARAPVAVPISPAEEVDALVSRWRSDIWNEVFPAAPGSTSRAAESSRASGSALRTRIWDPLVSYVQDARQVVIVPDGSLGLVPFAALPSGRDGFILEAAPPIHYLSSERDVVSLSLERPRRQGLLAIGGADFDEGTRSALPASLQEPAQPGPPALRGQCGDLQSIRFEQLQGTRDEVRELASRWPLPLGAADDIVGSRATESTLKQQARYYRVLHLATHGFFLDGTCLPLPSSGTTRGVGGLAASGPANNPLRLSGLVFAGANRRAQAKPDEDDGILTAEEVASLDLSGTEWAVLSACETGVGEIKAGEGVFGLRRAFQVAGARTVIMSLWSVEDQATRGWMRALYEGRFQRHLSTADAVHQASLTVLRDRRARGLSTQPFFWAAFVAAGDWR